MKLLDNRDFTLRKSFKRCRLYHGASHQCEWGILYVKLTLLMKYNTFEWFSKLNNGG